MLKPQDIVILLKLHVLKDCKWTYAELAKSLDMSASEVHAAVKRCIDSGLYDKISQKVMRYPFLDLILHGVKYIFYTHPGKIVRGIPTAHSAKPLSSQIVDVDYKYVWATADGIEKGQEIQPLYRSVPKAAKKDVELYELLSLVDAIRVGKKREYKIAASELRKRFDIYE